MASQNYQLNPNGIGPRGTSHPVHPSAFSNDEACPEAGSEEDRVMVESMTPPRSPSVVEKSPHVEAEYYQSRASLGGPPTESIQDGTNIVLHITPEEVDTVEPANLIAVRKLHLALYTYIFRFIVDHKKRFQDLWQLEPFTFTVNLPPVVQSFYRSCVHEKTCHIVQAVDEYVRELTNVRPESRRVSDELLKFIECIGLDRTLSRGFPAGAWDYFLRSRRNEQCQYVLTEKELLGLWRKFISASLKKLPRLGIDDNAVTKVDRVCIKESSRLYTRHEGNWQQDCRVLIDSDNGNFSTYVEETEDIVLEETKA